MERIVAMVVDTQNVTFYKEDGDTIILKQGDPRIQAAVDKILPIVSNGGTAELDLAMPNAYKEFEEKSSGLVKFFRVAKKAVSSIFKSNEPSEFVEPGTFGEVPPLELRASIDEIIAQAVPVTAENFDTGAMNTNETMIAVVEDNKGKKTAIPHAEKLVGQIAHSGKLGSTIGMENFYKRIANMMSTREHSVEDLIRFLEKGDLPIADDGCIVAYKILKSTEKNGRFVDCHTGKVNQGVGSFVCVDEKLVDKNRRNECSNGLHIARRGYINSFSGDVLTLCKIAPEDVVTVPHGDPNKVRVMGYHILSRLTAEDHALLRQNKAMTVNKSGQDALSLAIQGKHPEPRERVQIHGGHGTNIVVTPYKKGDTMVTTHRESDAPVVEDTRVHSAIDDVIHSPTTVAPKKVNDAITKAEKAKNSDKITSTGGKAEGLVIAKRLLSNVVITPQRFIDDMNQLIAIKRKLKCAWQALGVKTEDATKLMASKVKYEAAASAAIPVAPAIAKPVKKLAKPVPKASTKTPSKAAEKVVAKAPVTKKQPEKITPKQAETNLVNKLTGGSRADTIKALSDKMDDPKSSLMVRIEAATDLLAYRKAAKQSWAKLGFANLDDVIIKGRITNMQKTISAKKPEPKAKAPVKAEKKQNPAPITKAKPKVTPKAKPKPKKK